jgi:YVTN family beta-propeller protein
MVVRGIVAVSCATLGISLLSATPGHTAPQLSSQVASSVAKNDQNNTRIKGWGTHGLPEAGKKLRDKIRIVSGGKKIRRTVVLQRKQAMTANGWQRVWTRETDSKGKLDVRFRVPKQGDWRYRIRVKESGRANATVSGLRQVAPLAIGIEESIKVGSIPWAVAVDESVGRAYVTNAGSASVSVISTDTDSVIATIEVGRVPRGVAVDESRSRAYVTSSRDDVVTIIDTATNTVVDTIDVGNGPYGVAVDESRGLAFVVNRNDSSVSVINTDTNQVVGEALPVGSGDQGPQAVAVDEKRGRAYVANSSYQYLAEIRRQYNPEIDSDLGIGNSIPVGMGVMRVATDEKSGQIFATQTSPELTRDAPDSLLTIDPSQNKITGSVFVGENPIGVGVDQSRNRVFVGSYSDETVSLVDPDSGLVTSTIELGSRPLGIAVEESRGRAFVVTSDGLTIVSLNLPEAPVDVVALPGAGSTATVDWMPPEDVGDSSSAISEYVVTASPSGKTCRTNGSQRQCVFEFLNPGTTYTFAVTATNAAGTSDAAVSNPMTANASATPGIRQVPGSVRTSDGIPLPGVGLRLQAGDGSLKSEATTDSNGNFAIAAPTQIWSEVTVAGSGFTLNGTLGVTHDQAQLQVVVPVEHRTVITILDKNNQPAMNAVVNPQSQTWPAPDNTYLNGPATVTGWIPGGGGGPTNANGVRVLKGFGPMPANALVAQVTSVLEPGVTQITQVRESDLSGGDKTRKKVTRSLPYLPIMGVVTGAQSQSTEVREATTVTPTVSLTSSDGRPIAGAIVALRPVGADGRYGVAVAETATDSNGIARITTDCLSVGTYAVVPTNITSRALGFQVSGTPCGNSVAPAPIPGTSAGSSEDGVTVPGKVKKFAKGKITKSKATVKWKQPSSDGGSKITKYQTRIKIGKKWKKWKADKPKALKTGKKNQFAWTWKKLKSGKKHVVQVRAKNSVGTGSVAKLKFTTK